MVYAIDGMVNPKRDACLFDIPNVCGLKYTGSNFYSVQQLVRNVSKPLALMSGFDEQFVASLSFGFAGGIGSTYNFAPHFYADIYRNYQDGKIHEAAAIQERINRVTTLMVEYENWSYRKAIMTYIGFDCGSARPPFAPLANQELEAFFKRLDDLDVLRRG